MKITILLLTLIFGAWGILDEITKERGERIDVFFKSFLDDLAIVSDYLQDIERKDHVYDDDFLSKLTYLPDQYNKTYLGLDDPTRDVDFMLTHYVGSKLYGSNITRIEDFPNELISTDRNLTIFCEQFHPNGTYQPSYCEYKEKFNYDIVDFVAKFLLTTESLNYALWINHPETLGYYVGDRFGSFSMASKTDLGYNLGGDFIWPLAWYMSPIANPSRKATYMPPYIDYSTNIYIVTAQVPVYFGDFWWGFACVDIMVTECFNQIKTTLVPNDTMTLLIEPNGTVILASPEALRLLFDIVTITSDPVYIKDAKGYDFENMWSEIKAIETNETIFNIYNQSYVMAHSVLKSLDGWVFIDIVRAEAIYPQLAVTLVELSDTISWVVFVLSIITCLIPIVAAILVFIFRNESPVHRASPPFCILSMVGAFLLNLSPIFLTKPVNSCMAWVWLLTIGYVLFFGSLLVKTFRIERIFTIGNRFKKASGLTNKHLFPSIAGLLAIQIIILIVWTVVSPLEMMTQLSDGHPIVLVEQCSPVKNEATLWGFIGAQFVYCIFLIIAACYYSFQTRNVHMKEFREAKEIVFAVYNFSLVVVICVVIAGVFRSDPSVYVAVIGIGTIFGTTISTFAWLGLKITKVVCGNYSSESQTDDESTDVSETSKKPTTQ